MIFTYRSYINYMAITIHGECHWIANWTHSLDGSCFSPEYGHIVL